MKAHFTALAALTGVTMNLTVAAQPETLYHAPIERLESTEAIVSRATLAAGASLPAHWHPGEEFTYIVAGSITLLRHEAEPERFTEGSVVVIPAGEAHSAEAGPEGVELVTFRVHPAGEPVRVMAQGGDD